MSYKHLTQEERYQIHALKRKNISLNLPLNSSAIARRYP